MTPLEKDLRAALAKFGPNGEKWRNRIPDSDEHCSMTAIYDAVCSSDFERNRERRQAMHDAFRKAAGLGERDHLDTWNDKAGRTWPEVKAVFEKAIAEAA